LDLEANSGHPVPAVSTLPKLHVYEEQVLRATAFTTTGTAAPTATATESTQKRNDSHESCLKEIKKPESKERKDDPTLQVIEVHSLTKPQLKNTNPSNQNRSLVWTALCKMKFCLKLKRKINCWKKWESSSSNFRLKTRG